MHNLETPSETWDEQAVRGYELNAWSICPRKCWFLQRQLAMEPHSPYVELGRLVHQQALEPSPHAENAYTEVPIENFARVDKIAGELVYEIKRSPRKSEAHRLQLLYYLYLLRERGLNLKGVLHYPEQNRREIVELDATGLETLQRALDAVQQLRQQPLPPHVPKPLTICRTCAYQELCWCEEETP